MTPVAACSSSVSCWWVVLAGWMTRLLASPTLARRLNSLTLSMKRPAGVDAALDAERDDAAEAALEASRFAISCVACEGRPG